MLVSFSLEEEKMQGWRGGKDVILMKHYIFPYSYIYIYIYIKAITYM